MALRMEPGLHGVEAPPAASGETGSRWDQARRALIVVLGAGWVAFQFAHILHPREPMVARPVHMVFAMALALLTLPLDGKRLGRAISRALDAALLSAVLATGVYYYAASGRLLNRIELVDEVLPVDIVCGVLFMTVLLECVRRTVGWSLLGLLLAVLFYGFFGPGFPGWLRFRGFDLEETIEMLTMTTNGVLGITTDTSVQFVFYFIAFGAAYAAIGGGKLFIDIGLMVSGRHSGGAAKAAVVSSALMGTVSGSAVANVVSVGVFTIPLMRRAGYIAEAAAGIEAICSTGGQLMPPVMGIAAFVLAEMLQIDYGRVAWAGVIPALGFYFALFVLFDLNARKSGIGTLPPGEAADHPPIPPRLYLLLPPVVLVALLAAGYSATFSVVVAIGGCVVTGYLRRGSWLGLRDWTRVIGDLARQASHVAIPIAAIGTIIAIAVQSNLALKFSSRLIETGGANVYAALALTALGCIVMGMGLPTVAAYIIGAILFVPSLLKLGIAPLAAHFFVMYYCVLSMVTPPVALAAFAAAGLAKAGTMQTGWHAFRLSVVLLLIPLGFVFDLRLLGQGEPFWVLLAFLSLLAATAAWAICLAGYTRRPIGPVARALFGLLSVAVILYPTGSGGWAVALVLLALLGAWGLLTRRTTP